MRFLDTTVLVYANLITNRDLDEEAKRIKKSARNIAARVDGGEEVISSLVHFSEFVNILEKHMEFSEALSMAESLLDNPNVHFLEVESRHYQTAIEIAGESEIGLNDALAVMLMRTVGVEKIYSFDDHFDEVEWVERIEG